jgi:serine/threonine protein kinase/DNA-binding winged helix-turn-helix (wHTH) protein
MSQELLTQDAFLNQQYELGGRRIDPLAGRITAGQTSTHLRRKPLEVLAIIAAAEGRIVPRQAIIDQAWEGNNPVGEAGLNGAMWELRKALKDTDETQPLIRTIPRKGYQLGLPAQILRGPQPASFVSGAEIPGKPGWRLVRKINETLMNQSWLAEGPEHATRVFRFCVNELHLRQLKRETTLLRLVREGLAQRMDVVKILDWQLSDPPYFIEMAATSGQNMLELSHAVGGLSNYSSDERLRWLAKLADVVSAVHALGIVHRNLAAASVWLERQTSLSSQLPGQTNDYVVVLGEFGLGQIDNPSALHDAKITAQGLTDSGNLVSTHRMYLAPEILQGQAATAASDVYALGVLIYQLMLGDFEVVPELGWERPIASEGLKRLIGKCLESNPAARPDAATLAKQLHAIDARVATQLSPIDPSETPYLAAQTPAPQERKRGELARGQMLGSYRLLEKIGQGGMGTVYLAEQREPVQRLVAVKLILEGMDTAKVLARFEAERQALAMMSHSNIAAVYEAGSSEEARPYFAMEYVPGKDIIEHCDEHAFDVRQRIELFLQVCDGVMHAHQKGIIHRDLKPSNILIKDAQGQPATAKIIDFGVAKSLQRRLVDASAHTQIGTFVGTMTYSSPEQIFGNPNLRDSLIRAVDRCAAV